MRHIKAEPDWNTGFPIGINKKEFKKTSERGLKQSVSATAADLNLSVQPYIVSQPPADSLLWALHKMDNWDATQFAERRRSSDIELQQP